MKNLSAMILLSLFIQIPEARSQTARDTSVVLKESVISARKGAVRGETGVVVIPSEAIKSNLTLLGEADLVKAIQRLPGVQAGTEGLSGIYVRGGGSDENLILLDGVPIHCQGHLLGLFSPFQGEAVEDAAIHKGAFPARFGGRASSVIEINSSGGNPSVTSGSAGLGMTSDKFHLERPIQDGRLSFSLSARGMHTLLLDGILKAFKIPANLYFHDLLARADGRIDDKNSLTISHFTSKDKLYHKEDGQKTDFSWGTTMTYAKWRSRWGPDLSSVLTLARSAYSTDSWTKTFGSPKEGYRIGLKDLVGKMDLVKGGSGSHDMRFGLEGIRHTFVPEADFGDGMAGHDDEGSVGRYIGFEGAVYAEDNFKAGDRLSVAAGLRMSVFSHGKVTRLSPEPRISVSFGNDNGLLAKAGYSKVSQYIHQLSSPTASLPVDMMVPVTGKIGPETSDQVSIGLTLNRFQGWEISLEGYWKRLRNILEYKDGVAFIEDFGTWEGDVSAGIARSRGVELLVRKTEGRTTGSLGYTLSKSERRFPHGSISGGEWFPARYDCRHSCSVVLDHKLGRSWDAGAAWTYSSGGAFTVPEPDGRMPRRGNLRLPPSHRLDLGLSHHKARRRGERVWNLSVYNAYNRKNPNLVFLVSGEEDDGPGSSLKTVSFLPVIPSVSYTRVF